mgnify:CR=1 FL=1
MLFVYGVIAGVFVGIVGMAILAMASNAQMEAQYRHLLKQYRSNLEPDPEEVDYD